MRALFLASFAFALTACASSPQVQYFVLNPAVQGPSPLKSEAPSIAVGPVNVPELIDQPRIVLQLSGNQVALQEYQRWGSPLKGEIARVIAANLQQALGTARVWPYLQMPVPEADVQVLIDVRRFESRLGEGVDVEIGWALKRQGAIVRSGQSLASESTQGTSYNDLAAAHSRALARISREIAGAIPGR